MLQFYQKSQLECDPFIYSETQNLAVQQFIWTGANVYGYLKFLLGHRLSKENTNVQLAELAPRIKNSNQKSHMNPGELLQLAIIKYIQEIKNPAIVHFL